MPDNKERKMSTEDFFRPDPAKDKLKVVHGDLLELAEAGEFDMVVQGCNCFCTFGSGLARTIRGRYPTAVVADTATKPGDYNKLGSYTVAPSDPDDQKSMFAIVNAYTQYGFSSGEDVFEYAAFQLILQKLLHNFPDVRFGFPLIGAGLARGDEGRILGILEDFARKVDGHGGSVTLVRYQ
jgi:O-acetyl-ADP-ribose deacetylase (regulator of RNase III)